MSVTNHKCMQPTGKRGNTVEYVGFDNFDRVAGVRHTIFVHWKDVFKWADAFYADRVYRGHPESVRFNDREYGEAVCDSLRGAATPAPNAGRMAMYGMGHAPEAQTVAIYDKFKALPWATQTRCARQLLGRLV